MRLYYITALMLLPASMYAQSGTKKTGNHPVKAGFGVTVVQTQPEFPGGEEGLNSFIVDQIKYPREAKVNGIEGKVYVGFLVDKTGKISNERILSGINDELDAEAIRVIRTMPDWKPGTRGGENVDVQYILALDFILPPKRTE